MIARLPGWLVAAAWVLMNTAHGILGASALRNGSPAWWAAELVGALAGNTVALAVLLDRNRAAGDKPEPLPLPPPPGKDDTKP